MIRWLRRISRTATYNVGHDDGYRAGFEKGHNLAFNRETSRVLEEIVRAADEFEEIANDEDREGHDPNIASFEEMSLLGIARGLRLAAASITDKLDGLAP